MCARGFHLNCHIGPLSILENVERGGVGERVTDAHDNLIFNDFSGEIIFGVYDLGPQNLKSTWDPV